MVTGEGQLEIAEYLDAKYPDRPMLCSGDSMKI